MATGVRHQGIALDIVAAAIRIDAGLPDTVANSRKTLGNLSLWARLGSNQGPRDYESQPGELLDRPPVTSED